MVLGSDPQEALLFALKDLDDKNFKELKFHLMAITSPDGHRVLTRSEFEDLEHVKLASRLIEMYGAYKALNVLCETLEKMHLLELVDQLIPVCLNDYRAKYREHVRHLEEKHVGINGSYNQLLLVWGSSSGNSEPPTCPTQELCSLKDLFGSREKSTVVLLGSAGIGKTTLARKILLDWARGTLFTDQFDYVFYVSCREVVLLRECTVEQLLFWCCADNQAPVNEILRQPERLLFILDGYDELQRPFAEQLMKSSSSPMENLLHLLIRKDRLPQCSLFITTRRLALKNLTCMLKQPHYVHLLGFSEEEKRRYFSSYFTDEEEATKAFDLVQRYDVLYQGCQVPGICWVVCSWLHRQMEGGREIADIPSNSTDIYMAYVSTFLPPSDNGDGWELPQHSFLKGLCSLAAEGIQQQRFLFEEADLRKHNLDGPLLADFLSSNDYREGYAIKKFYSFRHISFQEFFYAMSHLVKENGSQLGQESRRELEKLLKSTSEDMTLSVQFLLDLLRHESTSHLELKLCFKISSQIMHELKEFKRQLEPIRNCSPWNLEFSLCGSKLKNLRNCVQMSDASLSWTKTDATSVPSRPSFSVKTSLRNGQDEEQKSHPVGRDNRAGTQNQASNGEGRGTEELKARALGTAECGNKEMGAIKLKRQRDGGV
ncbi:NACHT, LRR and PYD domains-containing protein 10 [Rhynchocyon petersi]